MPAKRFFTMEHFPAILVTEVFGWQGKNIEINSRITSVTVTKVFSWYTKIIETASNSDSYVLFTMLLLFILQQQTFIQDTVVGIA